MLCSNDFHIHKGLCKTKQLTKSDSFSFKLFISLWLILLDDLFQQVDVTREGFLTGRSQRARRQRAAGRDVEAALLEETEEKDLLESGEKLDQENAEEEADTPFPSAANAALLD